jgi:hypothetical protein
MPQKEAEGALFFFHFVQWMESDFWRSDIDSNTFSVTNNSHADSAPGGTHRQNAFIGT